MADPRRFAEDTKVPVAKSRNEIDRLLTQWGVSQMGWSDDFDTGRAEVHFAWRWQDRLFRARIAIQVPGRVELSKKVPRAVRDRAAWVEREREQRARTLHRLLLEKLKMDLNAVAANLFSAVEVFLPYIERPDGLTIAEFVRPRLGEPLEGTVRQLTDGR